MAIEHLQINDPVTQIDDIVAKTNELVDAINLLMSQDVIPMGFDNGFFHVKFGGKILRRNMRANTPWEEVEYPTQFVAVDDQKNAIEKNVDRLTPVVN